MPIPTTLGASLGTSNGGGGWRCIAAA
jgi:hypothetical protein